MTWRWGRGAGAVALGLALVTGAFAPSTARAEPEPGAPTLLPDAGLLGPGPYAGARRGTWTQEFGLIPREGILAGTVGYSGLPRIEYSMPIAPDMSVGGSWSLDLGYYIPRGGARLGMLLTAPIRLALVESGRLTGALRLEPGFYFQFDPGFAFGLATQFGFDLGYQVRPNIFVGGGVDVPMAIVVDPFVFALPILFGPVVEVVLQENLHLTGDLKLGPGILAGDGGSTVEFSLRMSLGVAVKF